ncbi:hypothetical protein L8P37_08560 [Enterobacter asburiae]|uniref:hypothetical protein n=1 Tax=Enterobacter asburiae TaxID=61645 RepID=UPI002004D4F2|nr:hypothetical protein [Enterobacter asburiae]MCK7285517.1 hypothetical protein [Enterobacter asburiae]
MDELYKKFDGLKEGLIHSKSKNKFYMEFSKTLGEYPTLALLGLNSRSSASLSEIKMIAYIAELYRPIKLLGYNVDLDFQPNVILSGVCGKYKILFEMQLKLPNLETGVYLYPDLKLTIVQHYKGDENKIKSIAIEYDGHPSHLDKDNVQPAYLRSREISYQILGPLLRYYNNDLKSKVKRKATLTRINDFIISSINEFEESSFFERKVRNTILTSNKIFLTCPVCEGAEKLGGNYCPACEGLGKIKKEKLHQINLDEYTFFQCTPCRGGGCYRCNNLGYLSREVAIEATLKEMEA